jgi:Nif-specific ferredoxin III
MSEFITGTTFGGTVWTPNYVSNLNQKTCIACGRCFKVCPRDVFNLVDKEDLEEEFDDDYGDFDDDDDNSMVMILKNAADCIGCEACSKVCPKNCFTHQHKAA